MEEKLVLLEELANKPTAPMSSGAAMEEHHETERIPSDPIGFTICTNGDGKTAQSRFQLQDR